MSQAKRKPHQQVKPKPVVLELRNVSFASHTSHSIGFRDANLVVREGELAVMRIDRSQKCREAASMLQGIRQPTEGKVLFRNQDWLGNDYDRHYRMRSQIGRVFEDHAWVQHFNVRENVTLARRHHRLADASVDLDVKSWTQRLKVPPLAYDRPAFVDPPVLQVYQWIRAMICKPALLILERPMNLVPLDRAPGLAAAINELRRLGTAVVWFASNRDGLSDGLDSNRTDYELHGDSLRKAAGGSDHE